MRAGGLQEVFARVRVRFDRAVSAAGRRLRPRALPAPWLVLSPLVLTACTSMDEGQRQTVYVPTPNGVEAQTVYTGRANDADEPPDTDEAGVEVPPGSDAANLRQMLVRLVVLTDYCWDEGEAYLGLEFGSSFDREYLRDHSRLKTRRSPLFNVHIQMACLFDAEDPSGRRPLSSEQARLVEFFMRAMSGQEAPTAALLADMRDYAERTESGEIAKNYLTDINQELFGVGMFSRISHGMDSCGSRFCRPLFHMCDPRAVREFREEDLAASFERICRFRDRLEARR